MKVERVRISGVMTVAKDLSLVLLGGLNLLEGSDSTPSVGECLGVTRKLGIACVLRASFDRASRLSVSSHEVARVAAVAEVIDVLQIPAFLARQADLVEVIAQMGGGVNLKKPRFLRPTDQDKALCDALNALPLCTLEPLVAQTQLVDDLQISLPDLKVN